MMSATAQCQNPGKLILKKGDKYVMENNFSAVSTQQMAGQSMDSKANFFTSNNIEVKDVSDNYTLANTYTKITASINAMGQDMNFDSEKKEDMEGEMGSGLKNLIGQPKKVVVTKDGKIIPDKSDTSNKDQNAGMMSMMMKQLMGDPEESGYGLSEAFMLIPAKAAVGFTWSDSSSSDGIKRSAIYTIKQINGSDAVVNISGLIDVDTKMETQGTQVSIKSSGKVAGEQTVDMKTGLVKQRNTTIESNGKAVAMGMEIPTTEKITAVSTLKNM